MRLHPAAHPQWAQHTDLRGPLVSYVWVMEFLLACEVDGSFH